MSSSACFGESASKTKEILLSPTGTGKTLAFLLPIIKVLNPDSDDVQALILVPSRELAIQIEQVVRSMGSGFKVNAVYGGRAISKDKIEKIYSESSANKMRKKEKEKRLKQRQN